MRRVGEETGKRVSYVELYLDLVFVLAVGRLAHLIVAHPDKSHVAIAFGLFLTLWWTWIGFAVLYNRHGADSPRQRLLFLAGSIPAGVAAVAIDPAAAGDSTVFVLSLAATRLLLAGANVATGHDLISRRISLSYLVSAGLLVLSLALDGAGRYVLWGIAIIAIESGALLHDDHRKTREARRAARLRGLQAREPRRGARPASLRRALQPVPDHPAGRGRGRGGRDLGGHDRHRRLARGHRRDGLRRRALVAVLQRRRRDQPARSCSSPAARRRSPAASSRSATSSRRSRCW